MELIRKCPQCGSKGKNIFSHVNCWGHKEYVYEVECQCCGFGFWSQKYTSGVQAKYHGIEEWNYNSVHKWQ